MAYPFKMVYDYFWVYKIKTLTLNKGLEYGPCKKTLLYLNIIQQVILLFRKINTIAQDCHDLNIATV